MGGARATIGLAGRRASTFTWEFVELHRRALALRRAVHPLVHLRGRRDVDRAADRLPARLRDRVPGGPLEERPAVRGRRAVLHHLPDPHDRLDRRSSPTTASSSTTLKLARVLVDDGRLLATPAAVIAGLTYNFLPFMILPIYASLERIDERLIEAAQGPLLVVAQAFCGSRCRSRCRAWSPARCSPSSPRSATTSTPTSSAARNQSMIGNVIQIAVPGHYATTRSAAALSFMLMALILVAGPDLHPLRRLRGADGRGGGGA